MKPSPDELKETLRLHKLWLEGKPDGKRAVLNWADLRWADLSGAKVDNVPVVENLDAKILAAISNGEARLGERDDCLGSLEMTNWHSCETTHCRAGWAIVLAGKEGAELERRVGSQVAGTLIYLASTGDVPDFYATNEEALADIQRAAEAVAGQTEQRP